MSASSVRTHIRRGENAAMLGLLIQGIAALTILVLSFFTDAPGYNLLRIQLGIGAAFWGMSFLQLRLRRAEQEEKLDLDFAEKQRKEKGLDTLFDKGEEARASRNRQQLETYIAPAVSFIIGAVLLLPFALLCIQWAGGAQAPGVSYFTNIESTNSYPVMFAVTAILLGAGIFLMGMFAAGLAKVKEWEPLRAGAGYALSSTGCALAIGLTMLVSQMFGVIPERVAAVLILLWMTLQGVEILFNSILDIYRPRTPGVPVRPAYDSRLSGLFAEPKGIFDTFAHTLDYQFGFKISESWFFLFLRKAMAPLIIIQLIFFYLLSCFVIVQPGDVAIIERWGAPRGMDSVSTSAGAGDDRWQALAATKAGKPLTEGLQIKYPWPIERAIIISKDTVSTLTIGFGFTDEAEAREKAAELRATVAAWNKQHVEDETHYLMPLPSRMDQDQTEKSKALDALFLSGTFTVEYRIGSDADIYRFQYNYEDSAQMLRVLAEREITAYLAGADFWDVMAKKPEKVRRDLSARITNAVSNNKLGLEIVHVGVANIHPPAGKVGAQFLEVIASQQDRMIAIHEGERDRIIQLGMTPSVVDAILKQAEDYNISRVSMAKAEASAFANQIKASAAAPAIYEELMRLRVIEDATVEARKILLPAGTTLYLDESDTMEPESLLRTMGREINRQTENK